MVKTLEKVKNEKVKSMPLGSILSVNARRTPENEALRFDGKSISYAALNAKVNILANALRGEGLNKGDKVALIIQNSDRIIVSYFAALKLGCVVVPISNSFSAREIQQIINITDSKMVIFDPRDAQLIFAIKTKLKPVEKFLPLGKIPAQKRTDKYLDWNTLLLDTSLNEPGIEVNQWDDCQILYTSGVKTNLLGALFDHQRITAAAVNMIAILGINRADKILHLAPLAHHASLNLFLLSGIYVGAHNILVKHSNPPDIQEVISIMEKEKINIVFGFIDLFDIFMQIFMQLQNKYLVDLSDLVCCFYGASPVDPKKYRIFLDHSGDAQVYNLTLYTEMGPGGFYLPPEDQIRKAGSIGVAFPNTEARVVDERQVDISPGMVGELIFRGETMMKGYFNNLRVTEMKIKNSWLHTGQQATISEEGDIQTTGR